MNHLSIDEIIEFVSLSKMTKENLEFAAKVNAHICRCEECLTLVNQYQALYDGFTQASLDSESLRMELEEENVISM